MYATGTDRKRNGAIFIETNVPCFVVAILKLPCFLTLPMMPQFLMFCIIVICKLTASHFP